MESLIRRVSLCVFSLLLSVNVFAVDGVRIAAGGGDNSSDAYEIGLLKDIDKTWFDGKLRAHWLLNLSHWEADDGPNKDAQVVSFAPVFVYGFKQRSNGLQPYIDFSLGVAYVTETKIDENDLGLHFQFDSRIGLGLRFGNDQRHDLSVSYRHISNAGLDSDNDGFDTLVGAYTYRF